MPDSPTALVIVLGSATPPGRLHRALATAAERATGRHPALTVTTIDLATLEIPYADGRPPAEASADTARVVDAIAAADAVVLASPTYRGSLTGALKNLIDHLPVPALRAKPVAVVAIGASDHHFLGVDRHLRDILTFFGAATTPTSAYLTSRDFTDGAPSDEALARLDALLDTTLLFAEHLGGEPLGPPPIGR
ncbi:NADPH-dependent FMN reductase [Baekduia alba]|uniref:NADPH-dependent FMN reductase n=1 Tax=Baekduia alba TaxID=2997333 RepID=UPI002340A2D5|nr:NADPH-dependent FMN reductase [Baekduia alba]